MKSKTKGKVGEREVAELLRGYGFEGRRGQQFAGGGDSPDVVGLPGFHIEVKRTETFNAYAAMDQAEGDAGVDFDLRPKARPVVFHRRSNRGWLAVLKASDFLELVKLLEAAEEKIYRDNRFPGGTKHG